MDVVGLCLANDYKSHVMKLKIDDTVLNLVGPSILMEKRWI
jgi:hypothetical protein